MTRQTNTTGQTNTAGLWHRAAQALGKLLAGMVAPEHPRHAKHADIYPRFPAF
jgi:hypothetical protein